MKPAFRITGWILAFLLLLLFAGVVALQSPTVQTAAARWATKKVQERLPGQVSIGLLTVRPFDAIVLEDILLKDPEPRIEGMDTLAYIGKLTGKFSLRGLLLGSAAEVKTIKLDGGIFNLGYEADTLSADGKRMNLYRVLGIPDKPDDGKSPTWGQLLKARFVQVNNFTFRYANPLNAAEMAAEGRDYGEGTIDWNDFSVRVDELVAADLSVADNHVTGRVERLHARETGTGFPIDEASAGWVDVGEQRTLIEGLRLVSGPSDIRLASLSMDGPLDDYSDFVEKINLQADIQEGTYVDMRSVRYFSDSLEGITFGGYIKGKMNGRVNGFELAGATLEDPRNHIHLVADGSIKGLPDTENTTLDFQLHPLDFGLEGVGGFVRAWSPDTHLDLSRSAPGERFQLTGRLSGPLNRLQLDGAFRSGIGTGAADITLHNAIDRQEPIRIGGYVESENLELDALSGVSQLGPLTMRAGVEGIFPRGGQMEVRIDSLHIDRLRAMDYDYSAISAAGTYSENAFDGRIVSSDPNLNFLFQGRFDLSGRTRNATYRFYASLGYADLHALHLDQRENSKISFQASSNFLRTEKRDLLGDVSISDITLESGTGRHRLGDLTVKAHANDNVHRIRLNSEFLEGTYVGDRALGTFLSDLRYLVVERDLPALLTEHPEPWDGASYKLSLRVKDAQDLFNFLVPGVYVENKTAATLSINREGLVEASVTSGRLAYNDKFIKDFCLGFNNGSGTQNAEISGSQISLSGARILDNRLTLFADDNQIGLGYSFDNGEESQTRAQLYLTGELAREDGELTVDARALPSNIYYNGNGWGLSSGDILYRGGDIRIDRLQARHEDEALLIHGGISSRKADTLSIQMEKFDIGLLNTLSGQIPPLEGYATGHALMISPTAPSPGLLASIACDSTRVAGQRMGKLLLSSVWDEQNERFNAYVRNELDGNCNIDADGFLDPVSEKMQVRARLNRLNMGYAEPLLSSLFSDFGGFLSGEVGLEGTLKHPHLSSRGLQIEDGLMEVDYTRVPYHLNGPVELTDDALLFRNVRISDGQDGSGTITGGISLGGFKDIGMDIHLQFSQLQVLDLPRGVNDMLYGNAFATGRVDITGPLKKILLDVDATTVRGGELHIPLGSSSSERSREMLTFKREPFVGETDPYEAMMSANMQERTRRNDFQCALRVRATPALQVFMDVDAESSLNARGTGTIELGVSMAQGGFSLGGDYSISEGSFIFSAMNLVSRKFTIQDGSTIRFNGDVWSTDLDIHGLYSTKASLANLISDETAVSRRPVDCGINISGRLRNPEVNFSIDVPDLSPSAQAQVEGALNTVDKVQKQFVYLLLSGSFLPAEESGVTNEGTNALFSNVSSIMSGQINNIFEKLHIPLDLGLNYQSTQSGDNLFDVALSTQLFNNRVIVNGTVGNKMQPDGTSTNDVAGDIDIEIKLNRSGSLRVKLFSHSADQFTSYLDNSQRHGGGFSYQREFNSFPQFLRELFSRRKDAAGYTDSPSVSYRVDSDGNLQKNE